MSLFSFVWLWFLICLFFVLFGFVLIMLYSPRKVHQTVAVCCIFHNLALRPGLQDGPLSHANDVPDHNSFSESGAKTTQTMHINDINSLWVNSPFGLFTSALAIRDGDLWCVMKALRWGVGSDCIQTASSQSECEKNWLEGYWEEDEVKDWVSVQMVCLFCNNRISLLKTLG